MSNLAALLFGASALLGMAAGLGTLLRARTAQCFPMAAALAVALAYAAGLAGLLPAGAAAVFVLGAAGAVVCVVHSVRQRRVPQGLVTAAVCLFAVLAVSYYANGLRMYGAWDEFSHWGMAMRATRETHSLARGADTPLQFVDYPPATALFAYVIGFFTPAFSEEASFVAMNLLCFCAMAPLLSDLSVRRPWPLLSAMLLAGVLPACMNAGAYSEIYVDSLEGILTGMALGCWFVRERTHADVGSVAALLFVLVLTKPSGLGLAAIVLAIAGVDALRERKLRTWTPALAATVLAKLSWSVYMHVCGHGSSWNLSTIDLLYIGETQKEVLLYFARALEERPLFSNWVPVTYMMGVAIFALMAWLFAQMLEPERVKRLRGGFIGAALGSVAYAVTMLLLYMYVYTEREGTALASYVRYMATYMQALWLMLLCIALREGARVRMRVLVASAVVILTTGDAGRLGYELLKSPMSVRGNRTYRADYQTVTAANDCLQPGEKLFIATCADSLIEWYVARYTAMLPGEKLNPPESCAMGEKYTWGAVGDPPEAQQWMDELTANYQYVYLCWLDDAFMDSYGMLFEDGAKAYTVYRVDAQRRLLVEVQE